MNGSIERTVLFTESEVEDWCEQNSDPNPLHTDVEMAEDSAFGERIVPGMMILDKLSGLLTSLGEDDETVILAGLTAARFRDPVFFDEYVTLTLSDLQEGQNFNTIEFEARVDNRADTLAANGVLSIVIRKS